MNEYITVMRTFVFGICWAGLLVGLSGCSRPEDPAVVINKSRPAQLQSQLVQNMRVRFDDQQIDIEGATVIRDKVFTISGEFGEGGQPTGPLPLGLIIVAYRPVGTPELDWLTLDHRREIYGPRMPKFQFPGRINEKSGEYEVRVYVLTYSVVTGMPTNEHVLKGTLRILPLPIQQVDNPERLTPAANPSPDSSPVGLNTLRAR